MNLTNNNISIVFFTYHDFTSHEITGGTRRLLELIKGFSEKGINVIVISPTSSVISSMTGISHIEIKNCKKSIFPLGLYNFFINFFKIRYNLKKIKYNYSIAIDVPYGIQMLLMNFHNINFIVWQDFIEYRKIQFDFLGINIYLKNIYLMIFKKIEYFVLKHVSLINVQCNFDFQQLIKRHPSIKNIIETKTIIIPNNINPSWLNVSNDFSKKFTHFPFIISFIGNLSDNRKGLHLLLEAFVNSSSLKKQCILNIIGSGNLLEHYKQKYILEKNIIFFGNLKNPYDILSNSSLLVVPSLADSFPNTILEALRLGVPVIGSRIGGIPEILVYDNLLFDPSSTSLALKLESLLLNEQYENTLLQCDIRAKKLTFDWVERILNMILEN